MNEVGVFIGLLGILLLGTMSPGPSFVLVARTSVARSRRHGLAAALGMGAGAAVFTLLVLAGLTTVLARVPVIYATLKILGGLWLLVLAWRLWRGAATPLQLDGSADAGQSPGAAFRTGLATQLTNPKTAVYYGSIFAALLPQDAPIWFVVALPFCTVAIETIWYSMVAFFFSAGHLRRVYLTCKRWIDRVAGTIMGLLGLKLIVEATHVA